MPTNNNLPFVDLPFFELCSQSPAATTAVSGVVIPDGAGDDFMYVMIGSVFYLYDMRFDTWQQLTTPPTAPATCLAMAYTKRRGFHAHVLAATSTTVTLPYLPGNVLSGEDFEILQGVGLGQTRTLTYVSDTTHDEGVITAVSTSSLTDSTKKWRVNQWAGYMVGVTFGTNATQYKKILYNNENTLTIADVNLQPHNPWDNQVFVANAPYAVPVTTAGSQAHYQIMSTTYSVPAWDTVPDYTTYGTALTGGIYLVSAGSTSAFITLQYYDIAHASWQTKTVPNSGLSTAALGTDVSIERTGRVGGIAVTGTATSATARTLVDSTQTLTPNRYTNYRLIITGGTGVGQSQRIVAHTATTFTVPANWDVTPDATSTYAIRPNADMLYVTGNAGSSMFAYSPNFDLWMQGNLFDQGVVTNISCTMFGSAPLGVNTGVRIASGVQAVAAAPTAGGTGYTIGDVLTCSVGGTGAQVRVTSIAPGGVVTGIELVHTGTATGFTVGTGRATTGGTGTGCTIEITAVGPTALITLATNHFLAAGNVVTFAGCTETAWNTAHTILGVPAVNTFCVATTATANMNNAAAQSATTIYDPTKNWIVNEHAGRLVQLNVAGTSPSTQTRWIISNTATTLTVGAITAGANGTSKYAIYDSKVFGVDSQNREENQIPYGFATGGSTTTLVDNTKSWVPNQWVNYVLRIEAGTGYGARVTVTSNTETTLTFTTQSFAPNTTTYYEIEDTWGVATSAGTGVINDTTKNWPTNFWAGKRVRVTAGTSQATETTSNSNTATQLANTGNSDTTTAYAILSIPPRGGNTQLLWAYGNSDAGRAGRFMYSIRGGATNQIDIYDIPTGRWMFGRFQSPQAELFTTGSSYAYDGVDTIYLTRSATSIPIRVLKYDINTQKIRGAVSTPYLQGTATIGNFLGFQETASGFKFLYVLQNSGTLLGRAMVF